MTSPEQTPETPPRTGDGSARTPFAWWDWDLGSDRITVQGHAQKLPSFPPCDLPSTGAAWCEHIHPDDAPRFAASIDACITGEAAEGCCEHRIRQCDGSWRWVLCVSRVTARDPAGRAASVGGVTVDVAASMLRDEILLRDAQMLSRVKQSIVCTDLKGIVTYWSEGAEELYGWTASEMVGRPFYDRMPTEAMREHARFRMATAASRGEFQHEREDYRKDGTRIYVESRVFAQRDVAGRVVGVIGTARDITARRRAEQERLELERQLLQAQKMETIGTLAGGVAHEFNNLLASIIGNVELAMLTHPDDTRFRGCHDAVLASSWRARDLVRRILTFSRSNDPERRLSQLHPLVTDGIRLIRAILPSTMEVACDPAEPPAGMPSLWADANQIHQVIMNLAANAGYALRERAGLILFRIRQIAFTEPHACASVTLPPGSYLVLDVIDDGCGIEAQHLPRIFDPFFTTKPVGEGSGLGLSVVHNIVCGHGGGIDVRSTPGSGTVFTLYFPAVVAGADGASAAQKPARGALPRGHGEHIAVIDDEESVGAFVEGSLRALGYSTRRYRSADEFYTELASSQDPFDLVLTDQNMPRLSGLGLARRLREAGMRTPIAIASGHSPDLTEAALLPLGRVALIEKPFALEKLADTVAELLARRRDAPGARVAVPE